MSPVRKDCGAVGLPYPGWTWAEEGDVLGKRAGLSPFLPRASGSRGGEGNIVSREWKGETGEGGGRAPRKRGPPFMVDFVENIRSNTLRDKEAMTVLLLGKEFQEPKPGS